MNAETKPMSESVVQCAVDRLHELTHELESAVDGLRARLSPVILGNDPDVESEGVPVPIASPLATELMATARKFEKELQSIRNIVAALDI